MTDRVHVPAYRRLHPLVMLNMAMGGTGLPEDGAGEEQRLGRPPQAYPDELGEEDAKAAVQVRGGGLLRRHTGDRLLLLQLSSLEMREDPQHTIHGPARQTFFSLAIQHRWSRFPSLRIALGVSDCIHQEALWWNPGNTVRSPIHAAGKGSLLASPACFNVLAVNLDGRRSQESKSLGLILISYLDGFDVRLQVELFHRFFHKIFCCLTIWTPFECQDADYHELNLLPIPEKEKHQALCPGEAMGSQALRPILYRRDPAFFIVWPSSAPAFPAISS